ncbi:MAG: hypothetical protein H7066_03990 [Cytophagaceae bacterium]|nr:hypothetical protein [Gemmatimonadaceae bacterium]
MSLPKGGGAVRGLGEKFTANPVTGTASLRIPLPVSPGRGAVTPQLSLAYDSGSGAGPFGLGWTLSLATISRRTDKGIPRYRDDEESDDFVIAGGEDLVPVLEDVAGTWTRLETERDVDGRRYRIRRYRPRVGATASRIERWLDIADPAETSWRVTGPDNVTTWYGRSRESRVANPRDAAQVFQWLPCLAHDDKGNVAVYEYAPEDSSGVDAGALHERHRSPADRGAMRYLKRVRYGNRDAWYAAPSPLRAPPGEWLYELALDYGDHSGDSPSGTPDRAWPVRPDPFSSYRPGFELRTYRRCERVLHLHHMPETLGHPVTLVRSLSLGFEDVPVAGAAHAPLSRLVRVTDHRHRQRPDGSYDTAGYPALEFGWSRGRLSAEVRDLSPDDVEHLPRGLDGQGEYEWVDLDGEGLPGVLVRQPEGDAWYYMRNQTPVSESHGVPAFTGLECLPWVARAGDGPKRALLDLDGDGALEVVALSGVAGSFSRVGDSWSGFTPFASIPTLDATSPDVRIVDLTGDGRPDLLFSDDGALRVHLGAGRVGFGAAMRVLDGADDREGPRAVFSDGNEAVYLADMSGDGLADIVRITRGGVSYWPNLGYGRFGARVDMDAAPLFDVADHFDPRRLHLADVDGSGAIDLVYLGADDVAIAFNQGGNGWSAVHHLAAFPGVDSHSSTAIIDLLGTGTACLVWSSPLPGAVQRPLRYVELMADGKPHLLTSMRNNVGAETHVSYEPSTRHYLRARLEGRPWVTRLPFPVHVVSRVETVDRIGRNRFASTYRYHHGYFDGTEREFRGFGLVEQWDTERLATLQGTDAVPDAGESPALPPILTRTWYHTGADDATLPARYAREFFGAPPPDDDTATQAFVQSLLAPVDFPVTWTADEVRQAHRASRGVMLRQEVFAIDGSEREAMPYRVTSQSAVVTLVQPAAQHRHAVLHSHLAETITEASERDPGDARTSHSVTLDVDDYGNVRHSVAVAYGRGAADDSLPPEIQLDQARTLATTSRAQFTNAIDQPDAWRTPLLAEQLTMELTGLTRPTGRSRLALAEVASAIMAASSIEFHETATPGLLQLRLLSRTRTRYRADDCSAVLADGILEPGALTGESLQLVLTDDLVASCYGDRVTPEMLASECRYVREDAAWWASSGRAWFTPAVATPLAELAEARTAFYLVRRNTNAFGGTFLVDYDPLHLAVVRTEDAVGNEVVASLDYRLLMPWRIRDPNGNITEVAFDVRGLPVATAVLGKVGNATGDTLVGFDDAPSDAAVDAFFAAPLTTAAARLGAATTCTVYDLFAYERSRDDPAPRPSWSATLQREQHVGTVGPDAASPLRVAISYVDGLGQVVQRKLPAEPDTTTGFAARWVADGWTIFNNKGLPVRKYEPFFSATHTFEFARLEGTGPVIFYDAIGRAIATLHPDGRYDKRRIGSWQDEGWDANDTVLLHPATDPDVASLVSPYLAAVGGAHVTWFERRNAGQLGASEATAAGQAAAHAGTPSRSHHDALGRACATIATLSIDGPEPEVVITRVVRDVSGNPRAMLDAFGRTVAAYAHDATGQQIRQRTMDAGTRVVLFDARGTPAFAWDDRGQRVETRYDLLGRATASYLLDENGVESQVAVTNYGEQEPGAESRNLRGRILRSFDQAGVATSVAYDGKGNLLEARRDLVAEYRGIVDWRTSPAMSGDAFTTRTTFDAISRPLEIVPPDGSRIALRYNEASLLEGIDVQGSNSPTSTAFVVGIDYDALGRRTAITMGNGARTTYEYDPENRHLRRLRTTRPAAVFPADDGGPGPGAGIQDVAYTYDAAGNITHVLDRAQQAVFFRNQRVEPGATYAYDALSRLVRATGREHLGRSASDRLAPAPWEDTASSPVATAQPADGTAMGGYEERYLYDLVGNLLSLQHRGSDPSQPGWVRQYGYQEASAIDGSVVSNRLSSTTIGTQTQTYGYDGSAGRHGCMTHMPHLARMTWNDRDLLQSSSRQVVTGGATPETTWYVYDASGTRVRKVTESAAAPGVTPVRLTERIYAGGFEVYREYASDGAAIRLERTTLHVMDGVSRVAMVETRTVGDDGTPVRLTRYQVPNHLGSASLELGDDARIISYEEYYPYGGTSHEAHAGSLEASAKRYRFTGMERDDETGLSLHGVRYYAPWLGRWTSADPSGVRDPGDSYRYCSDNPVCLWDSDGRDESRFIYDSDRVTLPDGSTAPGPPSIISDEGVQVLPETRIVEADWVREEQAAQEKKNLITNKYEKIAWKVQQARENSIMGYVSGVTLGLMPMRTMDFLQKPTTEKLVDGLAATVKSFFPEPVTPETVAASEKQFTRDMEGKTTWFEWGIRTAPAWGFALGTGSRKVAGPDTPPVRPDVETQMGMPAHAAPPAATAAKPLTVNKAQGRVAGENCGDSSGALLLGNGRGSTAIAEQGGFAEGLKVPGNVRTMITRGGGTVGKPQWVPNAAALEPALAKLPAGTNVLIAYIHTETPTKRIGHFITGHVGKGGKVILVDPQMIPIQTTTVPSTAIDIQFTIVTPAER